MIVEESKKGEGEQEEAEASVLWNRLTGFILMQVPKRMTTWWTMS
jgi:hypothetical protein